MVFSKLPLKNGG